MSFLLGFWLGLFGGIGGYWVVAHPAERAALLERIKSKFRK